MSLASSVNAVQVVLQQKRVLLQRLSLCSTGASAYADRCPLLGSSIGSHFRHSLNHIQVAVSPLVLLSSPLLSSCAAPFQPLEYDKRSRGTLVEVDIAEALREVSSLSLVLSSFPTSHPSSSSSFPSCTSPVSVAFLLPPGSSSSSSAQYASTVGRELHFAFHHATHHLAVVAISLKARGLADVLPKDEDGETNFGKAPATVAFEKQQLK